MGNADSDLSREERIDLIRQLLDPTNNVSGSAYVLDDSLGHGDAAKQMDPAVIREMHLAGEITPTPCKDNSPIYDENNPSLIRIAVEDEELVRTAGLYCGWDIDCEANRYFMLGGPEYTVNDDGSNLIYQQAFRIKDTGEVWLVDLINNQTTHKEFEDLQAAANWIISHYRAEGLIKQ